MPTLLTAEAVAALRHLLDGIDTHLHVWADIAVAMEANGCADPEAALKTLRAALPKTR